MLSEHMLQDKTYEDLMQEARIQIPLYSKEWTDFNPSDPAVTMLENISVYTILQQANMGEISDIAKEKIFSLLGYKRKEGKNSRVLLEAMNVSEPVRIPSGQRFIVGDISYETNKEFVITGNRILGIYSKNSQGIQDCSALIDKDFPIDIPVFTKEPKVGMELYIVMDSDVPISDEISFYVNLAKYGYRNKTDGSSVFAEMKWQYYTENGFMDLKCRDNTGCFLDSGEIKVKLQKDKLAIYDELPVKGYVIRCVLTKAQYDIAPRIKNISGFLFEVWQKETKSICYTFSNKKEINVYCDILEEGYIQIFCREEDGHYYKYERAGVGRNHGRIVKIVRNDFGNYTFIFDKEKYGYGPANFDNAIKIVAYNEEIMRQFDLGNIYGYDNQTIELPIKDIVKDSFSLIVSRKTKSGDVVYDFVKPSSSRSGEFKYDLDESEGKIVILDAADYINGKLFMCGCATTRGEEGNVRAGTRFTPHLYETEINFVNPCNGFGGRKKETINELKRRFMDDLQNHYTVVEGSDYERIVKATPGLCIHKVKAIADKKKNKVNIAVLPYGNEEFPMLSNIYINAILENLEERRLLGTGIEILQPVFVPVNVHGTIYVKSHFENCMKLIESVIRENVDYRNSEYNFGDRLDFDRLFHRIEALECVDYIYDLTATPLKPQYVEMSGMDIIPAKNCLLYPGEISIELNTME